MHLCNFLQELEIPDYSCKPKNGDLNERLGNVLKLVKKYYNIEKLNATSAQESLEKALEDCSAIIHQYRVVQKHILFVELFTARKKNGMPRLMT